MEFQRPNIKKCLFPKTMLEKPGRVGRNSFLPGRAVGGILVISIRLLVVE